MNISKWLNSGEYKTEIDEMRTNIMRDCHQSNSESTTASIFERELYFLIREKTGIKLKFTKEKYVDNITHKFGNDKKGNNGRLDAIINNLIIEYKHYTKLDSKKKYYKAINQVKDYLYTLHKNENIKYSAILTDGLRISYFSFNGNDINNTMLAEISNYDIDLIIKALLNNNKKKFVSENIIKDFSISYKVNSTSRELAKELLFLLKNKSTSKTKMLYVEWQNLMHLSLDDNGKGNDISKRRHDLSLIFDDNINDNESEYLSLYALQTTYAIIVKLIACKVIDKIEYNENTSNYHDLTAVDAKKLQKFFEKMEDGYSYKSNNIFNLLEGDFFSWYSDITQYSKNLYKLTKNIIIDIDKYTSFSFNVVYEPVDIFKDLYMGIIPRSIRHSMGEYFTPQWLADYVVDEAIEQINNDNWKAIDPCCGSGIFLISLIKKIVSNEELSLLSKTGKEKLIKKILSKVYGIDINPLAVLTARVGYYLALTPFGELHDIEIPVYLGDSAIVPQNVNVDDIECYKYIIDNKKIPIEVIFPKRLVQSKEFSLMMSELQACVKTNDETILYSVITKNLNGQERKSKKLLQSILRLSKDLTTLHKNKWDGIWIRISTNFMLIARLKDFDIITGNPPWVKWEHLPATYANKIKELCNVKHIFSNDGGQYGGTQLNICALISNVTATNWLNKNGILAFLMPDSIMSQNSYEEFRKFYINYEKNIRMYIQKIDRFLPPLRPFYCDDKPITQDFNAYYFMYKYVNYKKALPVNVVSKNKSIKDFVINNSHSLEEAKKYLIMKRNVAKQLSSNSTAFSYNDETYDFSKIIGETSYLYRTGVEFTPQELFILNGKKKSNKKNYYRFSNKKFQLSKYIIDDTPKNGWDFNTEIIYPIITSPSITPFKYKFENEFCILPYKNTNTKSPINIAEMVKKYNSIFKYLSNHKDIIDKQSEKSKIMHRGKEFYALSKIGSYTFAPYIVAARDNSKFCATVVNQIDTPWGDVKQAICVKHTIIISQHTDKTFISKNEAYYLAGILNSDIVIKYIENTFKKNGFSLNKSNLYIPLFNSKNKIHNGIVALSKKATKSSNTLEIQKLLSDLYLQLCEKK